MPCPNLTCLKPHIHSSHASSIHDLTHTWHTSVHTSVRTANCTAGWVMSHIWMSHVTHMDESCHTYVWHDSSICVTWLIHMCDMTHPAVQLAVRTEVCTEVCHVWVKSCMDEACEEWMWGLRHVRFGQGMSNIDEMCTEVCTWTWTSSWMSYLCVMNELCMCAHVTWLCMCDEWAMYVCACDVTMYVWMRYVLRCINKVCDKVLRYVMCVPPVGG